MERENPDTLGGFQSKIQNIITRVMPTHWNLDHNVSLGILLLFATLRYMQIIEISPFQAFRRSVVTVMQVVPKELRYVAILTLVGGAGPAIAIWLNKVIIDEITRLLSAGTTQNAIALILCPTSATF